MNSITCILRGGPFDIWGWGGRLRICCKKLCFLNNNNNNNNNDNNNNSNKILYFKRVTLISGDHYFNVPLTGNAHRG